MLLLPFTFLASLDSIAAQTRSASNFQLLKISQNLISPPAVCLFRGGATIAGEIHGKPGGVSLIQQIKYLIPSS